jgi:hypothetical protein
MPGSNRWPTAETSVNGRVRSCSTLQGTDQVEHAELLAIRTIVVNLHFALARGETLGAEGFQRLTDRADQDNFVKAQTRPANRPRRAS